MTDRKGVLVPFPPELLADLDEEANRTGRARMEIIIERCAWFSGKRVSAAPDPVEAKAFLARITKRPPPASTGLQLGPPVYTPGSRLKKR